MQSIDVVPAVSGNMVPTEQNDPLRRAVAARLSGFKGRSRIHSESDLRALLTWCEDHDPAPLQASRPHLELYLRWMREVRGFKPSNVSRGSQCSHVRSVVLNDQGRLGRRSPEPDRH